GDVPLRRRHRSHRHRRGLSAQAPGAAHRRGDAARARRGLESRDGAAVGPGGPVLTLAVIYRDAALVVVDKPAGMLSVPGRGEDKRSSAAARVQALHAEALVVHRLDMATSGLLVLARGAEAQRRLGIAFARREVGKRYVAVVPGRLQSAQGEIELPLAAD